MSRTLNFVDQLLARGRTLHERGRDQDAYQVLKRLTTFGALPPAAAEETQALLAEIQFRQHKYVRARRHLTAALGYHPNNAQYHYLMAAAVDADDKADKQRALAHYRRSLRLDPDQPTCLVDYGLLCLELGRNTAGLRALRRAARLAPDDSAVLGAVVEGLCQLERDAEAHQLLLTARFRNPRDPRFVKLWADFQFQQARESQEAARNARRRAKGGPVLLPFVRIVPSSATAGKRVRRDRPAPPPKPHTPRRLRLYEPARDS